MTEQPIDQYTLLCNRCGYIVEGLYQDANCPECGLQIAQSLPSIRRGTPWQNRRKSKSAMIETWFMTLTKPKKVIRLMSFDRASGKTFADYTPFYATSIAILSLFPMIITEGIAEIIFMMILIGIIGLVFWALAAVYFRIAAVRLNRRSKKRSYKIDSSMSWSIIGHAASYWTLIPASLALVSWIAFIAHNAEERRWIDPNSTINSILGFIAISFLFGCVPLSIGLSELFIYRASRTLRYTNQSARPLFSTDNQQLLSKSTRTDSSPKT